MKANRFYRHFSQTERWNSFNVRVETSDLFIRTKYDPCRKAREVIVNAREQIQNHILLQDEFLHSLAPVNRLNSDSAIVNAMYDASEITGVGPMAAVAGAIAEYTGRALLEYCDEIIVENGGDIWMQLNQPAIINIFPGNFHFNGKIGLRIYPEETPCGICTSSGKIGASLSFGKADSVTIIAPGAAYADAAATAICNQVQDRDDSTIALEKVMNMPGIKGSLIIYRDTLAAQGAVELVNLASSAEYS